jgi:hypothetical protein
MRRFRLWFWETVHDLAEKLWHWSYYKHLEKLYPPRVQSDPTYYYVDSRENEDGTRVDFYKS